MQDPHKSLKSDIIKEVQSRNAKLVLARLQWSKSDVGHSLHVIPSSYTLSGYQVTDFLKHLGFERSVCSFVAHQECYVKWADESFDIERFSALLDQSYNNLVEAQKHLEKCGFFFDQPEGWGYHFGRHSSGRSIQDRFDMYGDGHTATESKIMKNNEDDIFNFVFTWIKNDEEDKGWIIHYRPKRLPLSPEMESVFEFLNIKHFNECPNFDFEPCNWKSIKFLQRGDDFFDDGNVDSAHSWFDAHTNHFSVGIQKLLTANAEMEEVGLRFLPFQNAIIRLEKDFEEHISKPKTESASKKDDLGSFDVAISFDGKDRKHAEGLASLIKEAGFSVFYDDYYQESLWGKDLVVIFDEIYRKRSSYCVIFVSNEYNDNAWTINERRSAQARALKEKGKEYILPIKVDDVELDGMPPTVGYLSIKKGIDEIADLLIKKLKKK